MRLRIRLHTDRPVRVPFSHQELLAGLVYRLLGESNADYARFLHDEGYQIPGDAHKRFKLFTFSTLRAPRYARRITDSGLVFGPGPVDWYISSPLPDFLNHSAMGLLTEGSPLHIGPSATFTVQEIAAVPCPNFGPTQNFTCWTPIVAAVPSPDKRDTPYYLRPDTDGQAFSEAVRKNLLQKYQLVHQSPPESDDLTLTFDAPYLARSPHGGTKKVTIHNIGIVGAEAPLTLSGSPDLIRLAWETGLGQNNSIGFGMIEASR